MAFKKGHTPWNKGKTGVYSKETLKKMRIGQLGIPESEETKRKLSKIRKGKPKSTEWKRNIGKANIGKHDYSVEIRKKIGINTQKGMGIDGVRQMQATKAGYKNWKEYCKKYPLWKQYKSKVWSETRKQLAKNPPLKYIEKRGRCGVKGAYQLDHIISVKEGFNNHINYKKIAHISNLRMIPWIENIKKGK